MTHFRIIALAAALATASALIACTSVPAMPMGTPAAASPASADMAKMDAQMKTMHEAHQKMMSAKTPEERSKLMADHMKAMQDGMAMMEGMGDMKGMHGMAGMSGDMGARHQSMEKRMQMMQTMMKMMMERMHAAPAK